MTHKRNSAGRALPAHDVYAVVLVGGKGKRLRPVSTDSRPKAFLSVTRNNKTMFKATIDRISKIIPPRNILVVANQRHARLVREDFPNLTGANLLLEPVSRNTAPAIAFAAFQLQAFRREAVMVVVPTDQYIIDESKYLSVIKNGIDFLSKKEDALVTIGVKPTYPATGFGYIKIMKTGLKARGIYKVERFVEKPDLDTAKKYLKSGGYLWNTGVFIFKTKAILKAFSALAPGIYKGLKDAADAEEAYENLPDVSIDYAVMEKADNIYCVKGAYGWKDMGSFESIKEILKMESKKSVTIGAKPVKVP